MNTDRVKMARWRRLVGGIGGAEIAEVAVILPILVALLLAIVFFARAFNIYSTITYAAREGAQIAVRQGCATCASATPPTATDVANKVTQVLQASHIDPSQITAYIPSPAPTAGSCGTMTSTPSTTAVQVFANAQLNPGTSGPATCGVVVSFRYPYRFSLLNPVPPFGLNSFNLQLTADARMQAEN
jgi:Flp pilus assembly protein TadG